MWQWKQICTQQVLSGNNWCLVDYSHFIQCLIGRTGWGNEKAFPSRLWNRIGSLILIIEPVCWNYIRLRLCAVLNGTDQIELYMLGNRKTDRDLQQTYADPVKGKFDALQCGYGTKTQCY